MVEEEAAARRAEAATTVAQGTATSEAAARRAAVAPEMAYGATEGGEVAQRKEMMTIEEREAETSEWALAIEEEKAMERK